MSSVERLHPYFRTLLASASATARRLFADEVTLEHLIVAAIEDEESAANAVICHAFADPETVAGEALALAPGLMVVGSRGALAFSPLSVRALHRARERAHGAGWATVDCAQLLRVGFEELPEEVRATLERVGARPQELEGASGDGRVPADGPLFRAFDERAKRALSLAARQAAAGGDPSIGPARLVVAALEADAELGERAGLTTSRARMALGPIARDDSPIPEREPALAERLSRFLAALPEGAGSLELLAACHGPETQEIAALLARHKVHGELLGRARGSFEDPDE